MSIWARHTKTSPLTRRRRILTPNQSPQRLKIITIQKAFPNDLIRRIDSLEATVASQAQQIIELQKQLDVADKSTPQSKPTAVQNRKTTNMVTNEAKERDRRSKNLILRNIEAEGDAGNDKLAVENFIEQICSPENRPVVVKVQRITKTTEGTNSVQVIFKDKESRDTVYKATKNHNINKFANVFAHQNRTKAEQQQYFELNSLRTKKNEQLDKLELLDNPFRWVVCDKRIRCINTVQSRTEKKSIYVFDKELEQAMHAQQ